MRRPRRHLACLIFGHRRQPFAYRVSWKYAHCARCWKNLGFWRLDELDELDP